MALTGGARFGPYEVVSLLGSGGMGEVYRAKDTKLGRDVAIKVLPASLAGDPDRLARFTREAQTLAALNHPNIAHIHGFEDSTGVPALVMELVEGPTLADRIAGGPIPIDEALPIVGQIAEALEGAHELGIIHRDLKPANIKVRADGIVKVLDFGLAKAMEPLSSAGVNAMNSPTLSMHATQAGIILGTAAYMSPEQAAGKAVDKRSDLWAFGVVVLEMLTGRPVFTGETVSHVLASVLKSEPNWTTLPTDTPASIRRLLRRCLEKDRRARPADVSVVRYVLTEETAALPVVEASARAIAQPAWTLLQTRVALVASGFLIAAAAIAIWLIVRSQSPSSSHPARFAIVPPAAQQLSLSGFDRAIEIAADGTRLVYIGGVGPTHLIVRTLDQLDAVPLGGITGPRSPFLSPDGRWIGFFTGAAAELKKVPITGGPPFTLCRVSGAARGASWSQDDTVVFATSNTSLGLLSVPAGGGEPKVLTKPDHAAGEQNHLFPSVLPGGRAVLFTITPNGPIENAQIAVLDLKTGQRHTLIRGGSHAQYVNSGHLVYAAGGALRAVRFDLARLVVMGDPVTVVDHVQMAETGAANFSVSREGTLVYVQAVGAPASIQRSLAWVNRHGLEEPIAAPPRAYTLPRLSPDGTSVALDIRDQDNDIWIWDLARQTLRRLTFDPAQDQYPVWMPDGRRIAFGSTRSGAQNVFWQPADGTGPVERLTTSPNSQFPTSVAPDGSRLIIWEATATTGFYLVQLHLDGARQTEPLFHTAFNELNGEISPEGHWLAYQSAESGQSEIYVRPFPNVDRGRWQISTSGGTSPLWARSGGELFFLDANGLLTSAPVETTPTFSAGSPMKVFDRRYYSGPAGRTYDVSPDAQRFLMIKDGATGDRPSASPTMTVVLNWSEELKARVPTK